MKTKLLAGVALAASVLVGVAAFAQTPAAAPAAKPAISEKDAAAIANTATSEAGYVVPRTAWGAPDIGGFWNNTSITSLNRGAEAKSLVLTEAEAKRLVNRNVLIVLSKEDQATNGQDPNNTKLLEDKNNDRGYNSFWIDPGKSMAMVKGEFRSSWIVEPASGRIPYKPGAARGGGGFAQDNFDGPETRPQAERCILGFSGSFGPVMQNGMYNNTMNIVQTPTSVVIEVEMIHDARIIPTFKSKADAVAHHGTVPRWGGDSVGWYEGDVLVVETTNVHPRQRTMITDKGKLTERFSRWNAKQVLYTFEVDDSSLYTQKWRGEQALNASGPLYEYACHEGNYAMPGILAGARELESKGIKPSMGPGIAAGLVLPRDEGGGEGN
jgi:hypothetical protein